MQYSIRTKNNLDNKKLYCFLKDNETTILLNDTRHSADWLIVYDKDTNTITQADKDYDKALILSVDEFIQLFYRLV